VELSPTHSAGFYSISLPWGRMLFTIANKLSVDSYSSKFAAYTYLTNFAVYDGVGGCR